MTHGAFPTFQTIKKQRKGLAVDGDEKVLLMIEMKGKDAHVKEDLGGEGGGVEESTIQVVF